MPNERIVIEGKRFLGFVSANRQKADIKDGQYNRGLFILSLDDLTELGFLVEALEKPYGRLDSIEGDRFDAYVLWDGKADILDRRGMTKLVGLGRESLEELHQMIEELKGAMG